MDFSLNIPAAFIFSWNFFILVTWLYYWFGIRMNAKRNKNTKSYILSTFRWHCEQRRANNIHYNWLIDIDKYPVWASLNNRHFWHPIDLHRYHLLSFVPMPLSVKLLCQPKANKFQIHRQTTSERENTHTQHIDSEAPNFYSIHVLLSTVLLSHRALIITFKFILHIATTCNHSVFE